MIFISPAKTRWTLFRTEKVVKFSFLKPTLRVSRATVKMRRVQVQSSSCFPLCALAISILDLYSSGPNFDEMLLLETELPDELMQGGPSSWDQQMVSNKPPAQGPGPGQQQQQQIYSSQLNGGDDANVNPNMNLQRQQQQQQQQHQQQQQLAQLLQQVRAKNPPVHINEMGRKIMNLPGGPNAPTPNNMGAVSMPMSMAPNNNGTNNNAMMPGKPRFSFKF
jgi:hypothetical protein